MTPQSVCRLHQAGYLLRGLLGSIEESEKAELRDQGHLYEVRIIESEKGYGWKRP